MAFRFWRRVRIAKGVTLNISKGGISTSFGPRGAKYTVGRRGQRTTMGLPGTGLFYTTHTSSTSRSAKKTVSTRKSASRQPAAPTCHLVSDRSRRHWTNIRSLDAVWPNTICVYPWG